jgi:YidC/Oxa1 family membrane protein insertase
MMDQKNLILAIVVSVGILLGYQMLIEQPKLERERAQKLAQQQTTEQTAPKPSAPGTPAPAPATTAPPAGGKEAAPSRVPVPAGSATQPAAATEAASRAAALARSPRVRIATSSIDGSVALDAARMDDVSLRQYRATPDPKSAEIKLLSPPGAPNPYFAEFGWVAQGGTPKLPGPDTVWHADQRTLTPSAPVTLTWDNGDGLRFERTIAVDDNYLFTITQRVRNTGAAPVTLLPYGLISRTGTPPPSGTYLLHEGGVGVLQGSLKEVDYDDMRSGPITETTKGGWLGITDKYWLAALVPDKGEEVTARFTHFLRDKKDVYQVDYLARPRTVAPGATAEISGRFFAGAKEVHLLDAYENKLGIEKFDLAVDFGWFYFLTKPIFYVLDYFKGILGNFALAILALTVLIKLAFFPLANKSYRAMSRMKTLQPKMMELRERFKEDKAKLNQEMMALYKKENANPMAGCLPLVIQIPVFFALYKVLYVTIEMRHAPFFGWVHDLSAPDPTSILSLFGLFQWTPPSELHFLAIGAWPVIMGITMFLQQRLNPAPPDPVQQKMFMLLPIVFTFMLAHFPVGLVIYWSWNNTLSIAQQWLIMRKAGVKRTAPAKAPKKT